MGMRASPGSLQPPHCLGLCACVCNNQANTRFCVLSFHQHHRCLWGTRYRLWRWHRLRLRMVLGMSCTQALDPQKGHSRYSCRQRFWACLCPWPWNLKALQKGMAKGGQSAAAAGSQVLARTRNRILVPYPSLRVDTEYSAQSQALHFYLPHPRKYQ